MKQSDPSVNGKAAAAAQFRNASAAFRAAGDLAQAAAAAEQAAALESELKTGGEISPQQAQSGSASQTQLADVKALGQAAPAGLCEALHNMADRCYIDAVHLGPGGGPIPETGQAGAFLDCVRVQCSAMRKANCPIPIFNTKRSLGYCITLATDDPDFVRQKSLACGPGKHLFIKPDSNEAECQDNANGSGEPQPGSNSTITGIK